MSPVPASVIGPCQAPSAFDGDGFFLLIPTDRLRATFDADIDSQRTHGFKPITRSEFMVRYFARFDGIAGMTTPQLFRLDRCGGC